MEKEIGGAVKVKTLIFLITLCVAAMAAEPQGTTFESIAYSDGTHQYKRSKDASGKEVWVINKEAEESWAKIESRRQQLARDLVTRVLTEEEMSFVIREGSSLFVRNNVPYYKKEVDDQFNAAVLQQYTLREIEAASHVLPKNKIEWVGCPMVSDDDKFTPSSGWLSNVEMGLREDGVVVWRKKEGAK